jgi:hypothetical protein
MEMIVTRGMPGNLSIPGELTINGEHVCWTMENKADAISAGRFPVTIYDSPHLGKPVPLLNDVPGRSMIEMHWGNEPRNYKGCIGVGETRDTSTEEIFYTQAAFEVVFSLVKIALSTDGCWITVKDAPLLATAEQVSDAVQD